MAEMRKFALFFWAIWRLRIQTSARCMPLRIGLPSKAANTVGAYIAGALPDVGGLSAAELFEQPRRAVVLLNVEVEYDAANPAAAQAALKQAEFVVSVSMFKQGVETADVLLPLAPFTETAGTFIN